MLVISPSALADFKKSPLLYWLKHHCEIVIPRGAFPSLPGGMDRVLKKHYDEHRAVGTLPPELVGKITGQLFPDQAKLKKWRYYKTGLRAEVRPGLIITGALDDLLWYPEKNLHGVIDYKTRGAAPKDGASEEYYGAQMDCYDLMLNAEGYKSTGEAVLAYYWPDGNVAESRDHGGPIVFGFHVDTITIEANGSRAAALAIQAQDCLDGPMPKLDPKNDVDAFLLAVLEKVRPDLAGQVA